MRRAAALLVLLMAGCSPPTGVERDVCDATWLDAAVEIATGTGSSEAVLPIECIAEIGVRRLQIGFILPAGPDCHVLKRIDVVASADTVAITLIGAIHDDPNAGACPDEPRKVVTEMDLAAPIDDRVILDGSGAES